MAEDTERKLTRYRVLYRRPDGYLVEIETFDGPVSAALTAAVKRLAADATVESLVAVPTTNWTERRPKVQTITNVSFEDIGDRRENPEVEGDGA